MQPGQRKVRVATSTIVSASLIAIVIAAGYSAMLGFGVNERCDVLASSRSECDRLNWMALLHAGTQVALAVGAVVAGTSVRRATVGQRRRLLVGAVALAYVSLVAAAVAVYTSAAWDWANSRG